MRISEIIRGFEEWKNTNDKSAEAYEEYVNQLTELSELRDVAATHTGLVNYLILHNHAVLEAWYDSTTPTEAPAPEEEPVTEV